MINLKIKLGLFSLLAILAASVFLTSCEQESIKPEIIIEPALHGNLVEENANTIPDFNAIPIENSIPELSQETIDQLKTATDRSGCLQYNAPNFFPQIGCGHISIVIGFTYTMKSIFVKAGCIFIRITLSVDSAA